MRDIESDTPADAPANAHLGFRIAVAVVGLALLALFAMLGSVAMKQSATTQALDARESPGEDARPAPPRE
ncbi:MAG TPA: hypothetical protein PLL39_02250 [Rhodocyclaceae bacterium]|nr:hypothetical protein [Rhodocyclaceae bacterium]